MHVRNIEIYKFVVIQVMEEFAITVLFMKGQYFFEIRNKPGFDFRDKSLLLAADVFNHILLKYWMLLFLRDFLSKSLTVQLFKMSGYLRQVISCDSFENSVINLKI